MLIQEVIDEISINEEVGKNKPATDVQIATANVKLKQAKIPGVPKEMYALLKKFNGLSNNGCVILGANTGILQFPDLLKYNLLALEGKETDCVILGYDDANYLVYDEVKKKYIVIDKDDFSEEYSSENIADVIPYILSI